MVLWKSISEAMWLCGERKHSTEESGVSEHLIWRQDLTECVCSAGSRGRALTLVSFTKGVSPPQRCALYTLVPQTLKFTKWRGSLLFLRTQSESKTTEREFDHVHTSPSDVQRLKRTQSREKCLYVSSSSPGLSRSPVTWPRGAPWCTRTSTGQYAPWSGNEDLKAGEGLATSVIKLLWGMKLF